MTRPEWLRLLAPIPDGEGECRRTPMAGDVFAGWEQICLVITAPAGLRVVLAMYDGDGRPGAVSDLVAREGGVLQESVGGRIEPDGRVDGTHWQTDGAQHTPRPLTDAERHGLVTLAAALRRRWSADSARQPG